MTDVLGELEQFASTSRVASPMPLELDRAIGLIRRAAEEIVRLRGEAGGWEYGLLDPSPRPRRHAFIVSTDRAHIENLHHGWYPKAKIVRRRKAGAWEPIQDGDVDA